MHSQAVHHQHPSLRPSDSRLRDGALLVAALWRRFRKLEPSAQAAILVVSGIGLILCALIISFAWPRTTVFGYDGHTCLTNPVILPGLIRQHHEDTFAVQPSSIISVAGLPLYAHATCVTPIGAPRSGTAEHITLQTPWLRWIHQTINITAAALPTVAFETPLGEPVATDSPLVFPLSGADQVFEYRLSANDRTARCTAKGTRLTCNTTELRLAQSASYPFSLERLFDGRPYTTLFEQRATTVGAVQLTNSNIGAGQTVYDIPGRLTLDFNKPIRSFDGAALFVVPAEGEPQKLDTKATVSGSTITLIFDKPLPRSVALEARLQAANASDGGHLPDPLVLPFTTSGGPKVQKASIGDYKVATSSNITLTFDTAVSGGQRLGDFIRLEIGGKTVGASVSRKDNHVTIDPEAVLPKCTSFTVRVLDGLQNAAGVAGGSAWAFSSRTVCQSTFSIGKSVQNRDLTAYRFGSGGSTIVYAGTLHGNEKSATATLNNWVDYLERHYNDIPSGRTIVVIPNLNPDGYSANNRTNAHDVDLNRNFASANWKQSVTMPGGSVNSNGGGSSALSEPESKAFANYIASAHPRLVLDYHAAAGVVEPNGAADSDALAHAYDQKSNLNYSDVADSGTVFEYDTTGSFEDWANEKHHTPVLLIELWTKTDNEFSRNQNAMWYMATL